MKPLEARTITPWCSLLSQDLGVLAQLFKGLNDLKFNQNLNGHTYKLLYWGAAFQSAQTVWTNHTLVAAPILKPAYHLCKCTQYFKRMDFWTQIFFFFSMIEYHWQLCTSSQSFWSCLKQKTSNPLASRFWWHRLFNWELVFIFIF